MLPPVHEQSNEEIEAMKSQFTALHRKQLDRQTSNQFLLRLSSNEEINVEDQDTMQRDRNEEDEKNHFTDGVSSENPNVDEEDVAAMKAEFDKQQKLLLKTQIEKSFRLRTPGNDEDETLEYSYKMIKSNNDKKDDDEDGDNGDEFNYNLSDMDDDTEEKLIEDSEDMKLQYQQLNKMMIRMRSTKTLEMGMQPQIKPQHKEQFQLLLQDIGIVNEHIIQQLWLHIETTVHDDVKEDNNAGKEENDSKKKERDALFTKLQRENELLRRQAHNKDRGFGLSTFFNFKLCCGT